MFVSWCHSRKQSATGILPERFRTSRNDRSNLEKPKIRRYENLKVKVATKILEANDRIALENRRLFDEAGLFVINLMSAPGAGKTSVLEKTLLQGSGLKIGVIEGDIAGTDDAERIEKLNAPGCTDQHRWGMSS